MSFCLLCLQLSYACIVYAAQSKGASSSDSKEPTVVPDGKAPEDTAQDRLKEADTSISRINEENVLLRKVIKEIDAPLTGVEEVIRQEKMRMIFDRVNRNLDLIEKMRKEQEHQQDIIKQQQAIINQQRNLPK